MKKWIVLVLALGLVALGCEKKEAVAETIVGTQVTVVAPGVKVVEPIKEVVSMDAYILHRSAGKSLEAEGKFLEASDEFVKAADEASKLVGKMEYATGSPEQSQAWQLNSAGYMIILQHKKDKTGDLNRAKELLDKAIALKDIHLDCAAVIKSNQAYCTEWLSKKEQPKPSPKPEIKK